MIDVELLIGALSILAGFAGMLFARYFPRFGRALGYAIWATTLVGFVWILAVCIKAFGLFWGLIFGAVVTAPSASSAGSHSGS